MAVLELPTAPPPSNVEDGSPRGARLAEGIVVVRPAGVLDGHALRQLDIDVASAGPAAVIVDLTECTLGAPRVAAELRARRWGRTSATVCLVCRRLTGRRLLARVGVPLAVFQDVRDATQSRVLQAAGYGRGWA